jgi:hypothetical protein
VTGPAGACEYCGDPVFSGDRFCWWHRTRREEFVRIASEQGIDCGCADGPRPLLGHHTMYRCPVAYLASELSDEGFYEPPVYGPKPPSRAWLLARVAELERELVR